MTESQHPARHSRREFIAAAASAAAALSLPEVPVAAPPDAVDFWSGLRREFVIPSGRIYLNVGTLGAQPRSVVEAAIEHMWAVASTFPPPLDWDRLKRTLAALLACDPAGLVFTRNATEAMNFVANGLELSAGDEVLTTTHEHIGGLCCWELQAARRGVRLRQLPLPIPPEDPAQIVEIFRRAWTPRTRVVSVSHVTFTTGLVMPVRELSALCRERGGVFVVDGAHPPGMMPVSIDAIAPDFYASSTHKWLLAPQGSGFLWMSEAWRARLWPTIASGGWNDLALGAHRLNHVGTLDESRLFGLQAALDFHAEVGAARIHARIAELRERLAAGLAAVRGIEIVSPARRDLAAGMISFRHPRLTGMELQQRLAEHNVRTRVIGEYDYGWMRLSPHVYVMPEEIDRVVELIARA